MLLSHFLHKMFVAASNTGKAVYMIKNRKPVTTIRAAEGKQQINIRKTEDASNITAYKIEHMCTYAHTNGRGS